jgi:glycosyltransferase involved in cell wall biosynthesis
MTAAAPTRAPAPRTVDAPIRVGLTELHGQAAEIRQFAAASVEYRVLERTNPSFRWVRSPIKGFLSRFADGDVDLIEAQLTPILTDRPWICTLAALPQATAFSLLNVPLPRSLRVAYIRRLLMRDNCKRLVFMSEAGRQTLHSYGGIAPDDRLLGKVSVIYPAVREVPNALIRYEDRPIRLLFSGDFFRKGGMNTVDAFARAQQRHPGITLTLCCSDTIDFNTPNAELRKTYLAKIAANPAIELRGRIKREEFLQQMLPACDVYMIPTYAEAFGMAVLEAMAYGRPIVATNVFAIPEMLTHETSGLLVDVSRFDTEALFRGYVVDQVPREFGDLMTDRVFHYVCRLAESRDLRMRLGTAALATARSTFSFARRNREIGALYREAIR